MPYISRINEQILNTFTWLKDDSSGFYTVNTDDGGYVPYHQIKEYTDVFFEDLKILLEEAAENGLDVSCDDTDKSFTLFGQKFYCFCIESQLAISTAVRDARYSIVPIIYKENYKANPAANIYEGGATSTGHYASGSAYTNSAVQSNANAANGYLIGTNVPISNTYHTNHFYKNFNRYLHDYHMNYTSTATKGSYYGAYHTFQDGATGYGKIFNYIGFNLQASLCENYTLRNFIKYKIHVYYNDNYLYITYSTLHDGYVRQFPIGFFIKGVDCLHTEVLLTTLTPTLLSNSNTLHNKYNTNVTNMFTRVSIWSLVDGEKLYEQDMEILRTFNIDKYPFVNEYLGIDNTKFAKIGLQALNGLITFDNAIIGEISEKYHTFTRGQYYVIDDETYYVPIDAGIDVAYTDKATYNAIFLKM